MDRIAIISDTHGNLPAFEAVLADIERHDVKHIFCLGDLAGKGPSSAQVVDLCRERCDVTVKGNWDDFIVNRHDHPTAVWHQEALGAERVSYLHTLPNVIDFWLSGRQVRLFHASQESIYHRIHMYDTYEKHQAMFTNTPFTGDALTPDIVGYGDIHSAFVHSFEQRILFNVGSVGNPLDLTLASYALLHGHYGSDEAAAFSVQLMRVPYDIERAIEDARESQMPDIEPYANELRTGRYRGLPTATK